MTQSARTLDASQPPGAHRLVVPVAGTGPIRSEAVRTEGPRRVFDTTRRERSGTVVPTPPRINNSEDRRLTVGRDISLAGEITDCDVLVIEGRVNASLAGCDTIEVAQNGLFKGSAIVKTAEIHGRFEGDLTVRDRLIVRATGCIQGTVRYARVQIDLGGEIIGEMIPEREPPAEA